ncbi:MAG: heavy metal-associated domain-containing protein [Clostridiaceae bacterium]|nr:heavy metal-associated domain-containing protein [Clostridia bacterium]MDY3870117.1 heavy metal-associated domain-containing protein [Clostridiaceae bacterium]
MTKTMQITGMMCQHCVAHVSKALNAIPGVTAQVQLEQNRALITMDRPIADETLIRAVTDAGYQAELLN